MRLRKRKRLSPTSAFFAPQRERLPQSMPAMTSAEKRARRRAKRASSASAHRIAA